MKFNKKYLAVVSIVVFIVIVVGMLMLRKANNAPTPTSQQPTEAVIPTIDSSVKVDLTSSTGGKEVLLEIKNIPSGTQTIDYELSYQTKQQGLQGVIGTITLNNEPEYQKKITLGTCSSGKCVYHEVVGKIKLSLKFTGSYGEKVFEKEYEI